MAPAAHYDPIQHDRLHLIDQHAPALRLAAVVRRTALRVLAEGLPSLAS
jgi:hypothetical protein